MDKRELIPVLLKLSDRDWSEIMYDLLHTAKQNDRDLYEHYVVAKVSSGFLENGKIDETSWEVFFLAVEDKEAYSDVDEALMPEDATQYAVCQNCKRELLCHVKRGYCPICHAPVYLT